LTHIYSEFNVGLTFFSYNQYTFGSENLNNLNVTKLQIFGRLYA